MTLAMARLCRLILYVQNVVRLSVFYREAFGILGLTGSLCDGRDPGGERIPAD